MVDKLSNAKRAEMCHIFAILDVNGSGFLTASMLSAMMRVFGYENSEEDVQRMIDAVDTDGTGKMDCDMFCAALLWTFEPEKPLGNVGHQPEANVDDSSSSGL